MNISRTSFRKPLLATALALAGLGIAGQANATAYSYARAELQNFAVVFGTTPTDLTRTRQTITASTYTGYPNGGNNSGVANSGISDALQAFSGPGPAPAQNDFSRYLQTNNVYGARGDAYTAADLTQVVNISESNVVNALTPQSGTESARNVGTLEFTVGAGGNTVQFQMNSFWDLYASVDRVGDNSESSASAVFSVKQDVGGTLTEVFKYTAFDATCAAGPGTLTPCAASSGGFVTTNSTVFNLVEGSYSVNLLLDTTGSENAQAVPEPATMSLLGAGLVGLAAARRRKAKAKAEAEKAEA